MAMFIVCFEEVSRLSFVIRDEWQDHLLLKLEADWFSVPPTVWLGQHGSAFLTEVLEVGYFSYFVLLIFVGGMLYPWKDRRPFRRVMDATVLAYVTCYVIFILFPTEGPAHTLAGLHNFPIPGGGPFHWMVGLIQRNAGVHGNAFPSAHVAGGVVALYFAWRYVPKLGGVLTPLVLLLCVGAVYDRYHYFSDVVAGAIVGAAAALMVDYCNFFAQADDYTKYTLTSFLQVFCLAVTCVSAAVSILSSSPLSFMGSASAESIGVVSRCSSSSKGGSHSPGAPPF